mgnify:FL=1
MIDYLWMWSEFMVRWLHVVAGIAWIGSSFYFIALDLSLKPGKQLPDNAHGEAWQVHGGGFYHIQKYMVAPTKLPEHLTWFKWESYWAWMSGFILLALVYYAGAELLLVDPEVLDISPAAGIAISIGSLIFGWIAYDFICKSPLGRNNTTLMLLLYVLLVIMAWGYTQVFTPRAAFLHLGAFTATIMSANVFLTIIPSQRIVVADLKAGRTPEAKHGILAKQRSTHNNYLTLPVVFLMLSNHYPQAFATEFNWVIASLIFLMGVTIRHYFNSVHGRKGTPIWTWGATVMIFIIIMWLSAFSPLFESEAEDSTELTLRQQRFAAAYNFDEVRNVVQKRCAMCHASMTTWEGIIKAPKGVKLETDRQIAAHARDIYIQAGHTRAMPPANVSLMEDHERRLIVEWYESVAETGLASLLR